MAYLGRGVTNVARRSSDFELTMWFFMRVSGTLLLGIAVFHLLWMHYIIGVDHINFQVIAGRWTGPHGAIWRLFDLSLLVFSFVHGANGARWVIDDYIHARGLNLLIKWGMYMLVAIFLLMGAYTIFSFNPAHPAG